MSFTRALIVTVVALHAAVPGASAQKSGDEVYAAQKLIGRWRAIVNERFEDSRVYASEETADSIEEFLSPGAVRAVHDRLAEPALANIDAAVERFAVAMLRAGTRREDGSTMVTSESVEAAEKSVCPVYPFCD